MKIEGGLQRGNSTYFNELVVGCAQYNEKENLIIIIVELGGYELK